MFGNLNSDEIEVVLHSQLIGRIGCHENDITYIVPISYAYDGEFIYALTHEGMKIRIMRQNRQVCFEVEKIPDLANWQTVICWGEFEELPNRTERHHALEMLHARHLPNLTSATTKLSPMWPFRPDNIDKIKGVVFRIRLTKKTGRYEKSEDAAVYAFS
ncbi:MAG: pyridoxamine 5'-phosphate oxidase family protein [Bacteroidota bacterium]|nr:pyridoxamine 5'-phosphate oxidase family protein [Bacteroidota bacterium]